MTSLITPDAVRARFETDLVDVVLQPIIDAEEAEIIARYGAHASATETRLGDRLPTIMLARPASAIVSVVETWRMLRGVYVEPTVLTLDPSDYALAPSQRLLRLATGTHGYPHWGDQVVITYTPVAQTAQRAEVLMKLVGLSLAFSGFSRQSSPDLSESPLDPVATKRQLLRSLGPGISFA